MKRQQRSGLHHAALAALAREIASDLLTDGFGDRLIRLDCVVYSDDHVERISGCWRIEKLERRILRHLRGEMR